MSIDVKRHARLGVSEPRRGPGKLVGVARIICLVAALALSAASAHASECIGFPTTTLLDRNNVVFSGVVTEIRLLNPEASVAATLANKDADRSHVVAVTFKVTERYTAGASEASSPNGELVLHQWAALGSTDYWHRYEVGHRYLVFASTNQQTSFMKPAGIVSRGCDAWDLASPRGQQVLKELGAALP